jgi:hypothetical protein
MNAVGSWRSAILSFVCAFVCAFACGSANAHPPGPPAGPSPAPHLPGVPVPQPWAPSTLPAAPRFRDGPLDLIEYRTVDYRIAEEAHGDGFVRCPPTTVAREDADTAERSTSPNAIDWCALPPFVPRYAPQMPAAWWWYRHRAPWRYRGP